MASLTNAAVLAVLDQIDTDLGANALIRVYDGTVPTNADTALSGNTLLAELTMDATNAFGAATDAAPGGTMTANAITDDSSADATGTPTFARLLTSGASVVAQVTAGVGSGELDFTTSITSGQPVQISSLVITMAEA